MEFLESEYELVGKIFKYFQDNHNDCVITGDNRYSDTLETSVDKLNLVCNKLVDNFPSYFQTQEFMGNDFVMVKGTYFSQFSYDDFIRSQIKSVSDSLEYPNDYVEEALVNSVLPNQPVQNPIINVINIAQKAESKKGFGILKVLGLSLLSILELTFAWWLQHEEGKLFFSILECFGYTK